MMNNRLQALANQAELYVDLCGRPYPRAMSAEEADAAYKKFGQLIVRECCQFEKSYSGDAGLVARHFSRKIKEHFGVEE